MEVRRCGNCKSFMRDPHAAILGACSPKFKRRNGEFTYDLVDSYDQPCALYEQKAFDGLTLPRDMEWLLEVWPKWSNGEYCKFGDWWKADEYGEDEPQQLRKIAIYSPDQLREWGQDEGENYGYEWDFVRPISTTYRPDKVEPPAPKAVFGSDDEEIQIGDTVYLDDEHASNAESSLIGRGTNYGLCGIEPNDALVVTRFFDDCVGFTKHNAWCHASWLTHKKPVIAADGERLRVGEAVWHVTTGAEYRVLSLPDGEKGAWVTTTTNSADKLFLDLAMLTHRAPVLAADDKPLYEGETVWFTDNGENKLTVTKIVTLKDGASVYVRDETDDDEYVGVSPSQLTHERPDSWERLEEDALKDCIGYFRCNRECNTCRIPDELGVSSANYGIVAACAYAQRKDLVRRAKKLAWVE